MRRLREWLRTIPSNRHTAPSSASLILARSGAGSIGSRWRQACAEAIGNTIGDAIGSTGSGSSGSGRPPLTGGKRATSSPSFNGVEEVCKALIYGDGDGPVVRYERGMLFAQRSPEVGYGGRSRKFGNNFRSKKIAQATKAKDS